MNIHIGRTIARLRREKGITQEQLAAILGVSAPAVSKWETGQSYPDITLLPPLARYFGITVDHLLAYEAQLTEEERDALFTQTDAVFAKEGWDAGLAHIRQILQEYPSDMELRMLMAMRLMGNMVFAKEAAQREDGKRLQIEWMRQAAESTDGKLQLLAQYQLGLFYLNNRQPEEAEAMLLPLEDLSLDVRAILPSVRFLQARYDDGIRLAQANLYAAILNAVTSLTMLISLAIEQKDFAAARRYEETAQCLARETGLEETLASLLCQMRVRIAYATGDTDALLRATEQFVDATVTPCVRPGAPLFDHLLQEDPASAHTAHDYALMQLLLDDFAINSAYDAVRDTPRFAQMVQKLQAQLNAAPESARPASF